MIRIQYHPDTSFIHKLHPITKLIWLLLLSLALFFLESPWLSTAVSLSLLLILFILQKSATKLRGIRLAILTAIFLFFLQAIFFKDGEPIFTFPPMTDQGLIKGLIISSRFLSIILISYIFVLTTSPSSLSFALMRLGVPYRFGFMFITSLRLITILEDDARTIHRAQILRGVNYGSNQLSRLWQLPRQFFLPVLVSALSRVDALNFSMEGRCFGKYQTRTYLTKAKLTWRDPVMWTILAGLIITTLAY